MPAGVGGTFTVFNGTTGGNPVTLGNVGSGVDALIYNGYLGQVITNGTSMIISTPDLIPGTTFFWMHITPFPAGYVLPFGQVLSQATYPGLYGAYGSSYNQGGEGAGNFRMPDLRSCCLIASDIMGGSAAGRIQLAPTISPNVFGEGQHVLSIPELAAHGHGVYDPGHNHGFNDPGHVHQQFLTQNQNSNNITNGTNFQCNKGVTTATTFGSVTGCYLSASGTGIGIYNSGNNSPHNNVQPSFVGSWLVKT